MEEKLYQEELLDHYRYPRNYGVIPNADIASISVNPSCGDAISLSALIVEGIITKIFFQGQGCVISQSSASMLTVACLNQPLEELEALSKSDIISMIGITLGPTRLRCALLALEALHEGLRQYRITQKVK